MRRRELLTRGAALAGSAAVVGGLAAAQGASGPVPESVPDGERTLRFHGRHQAGIEIEPQAHQSLVALDLHAGTDADAVRRLLGLLTDDARRLTDGRGPLADLEPELAATPARLTVTFGFGAGLVAAVRGRAAVPDWLGPLPHFAQIDRLQDRWSGGDLLLQIAADDPTTVAHAMHLLVRDTRAFADVRWAQTGFRNAAGSLRPGTTMRNLFGQVDGTANVAPGSPDFAEVVWRGGDDGGDDWLTGGTTMVVRRIAMHLDTWEKVDRGSRVFAIGRRLTNGAPLTGRHEHDEPDLTATDARGFTVIAPHAHLRRARTDDPTQRIVRRAYNYDLGPTEPDAVGLVFAALQADLEHQFLPLQQRLAEADLLNEWTTPIGSAVFAVPGGIAAGEIVGQRLFA